MCLFSYSLGGSWSSWLPRHTADLCSTCVPMLLSPLLCSQSPTSLCCYWGLFHPGCRTSHWSFLNLTQFLVDKSPNPARSLCVMPLHSSISTFPHSLVSSASLVGCIQSYYPYPLQRQGIVLRSSVSPRGTPLMISYQLDFEALPPFGLTPSASLLSFQRWQSSSEMMPGNISAPLNAFHQVANICVCPVRTHEPPLYPLLLSVVCCLFHCCFWAQGLGYWPYPWRLGQRRHQVFQPVTLLT